jgi:ABC-type amino acid transport substrate-binding protein
MGALVDLAMRAKHGESDVHPVPEDRLPDPAAEVRRQRVLAMLADNLEAKYAVATYTAIDPEFVLLTLAIRDRAVCELLIPRDRYDGTLLLDLIERHAGTVH